MNVNRLLFIGLCLAAAPAFAESVDASCTTLDGKYTIAVLDQQNPAPVHRTAIIRDAVTGKILLGFEPIFAHTLEGGAVFYSDDESGTGGGSFQLSHGSLLARQADGSWLRYRPTPGHGKVMQCDF